MKNLQIIISVLFVIVMLYSCKEDELNENFLWYIRLETGCANPWDGSSSQSDSDLKNAVKVYLNEMNIEYDKVVVGHNPLYAQVCLSCLCTTGRYIEIHAPIIHEEILNEIGFFVIPDEE